MSETIEAYEYSENRGGNLDRFGRTPEQVQRDRHVGQPDYGELEGIKPCPVAKEYCCDPEGMKCSNEGATQCDPFLPGSLEMAHYLLKAMREGQTGIRNRVEQLERVMEWADIAIKRDGSRLNALENRETTAGGNSREYYEQQIEEISAKWQEADAHRQAAESEFKASQALNRQLADTIADLREMIGSRDAIIAQKNRELEVKYSYHSQIMSDAKLGAMVRQMDLSEFPVETCAKILECITGAKSTYNGQEL